MRLKKCYIENFGGLSKTTINFDEHITVILEQNGFGKTTLANFIKAMFYGFSGNGRQIKDNERKKYMPWNGGKFGGYIEFEYLGCQLKLERYFGKTPRYDEIRLYDLTTNRETKDVSPDIGSKIFKIDAKSFIRSVYIEESPVQDSFETDSIKARLANLVDDSDDINNYEKAKDSIGDKVKEISSNRRENSSYKVACNNINSLDAKLSSARQLASIEDSVRHEIDANRAAMEEAKSALDETKQKINAANSLSARKTVVDQINSLDKELAVHRDICSQFEMNFPNGVPNHTEINILQDKLTELIGIRSSIDSDTREVIESRPRIQQIKAMFNDSIPDEKQIGECRDRVNRIIAIRARQNQQLLTEVKQDKLRRLREKFKSEVPSEITITNASILNDEIVELDNKIKSIDINSDRLSLALQEQYFSDEIPTKSEIDDYRTKANEANRIREINNQLACEIGQIPQTISNKSQENRFSDSKPNKTIGIISGAAIILVSIIAGLIVNPLVFAGAGLGAMIVILSMLSKNKARDNIINADQTQSSIDYMPKSDIKALRDRMLENSAKIQEIEQSINIFISRYAVKGEGIAEKLNDLDTKVANYNSEKSRVEALETELKQLELELAEKRRKIHNIIGSYIDLSRPFADSISSLKTEINEYYSLQSEASSIEQAKVSDEEELVKLTKQVTSFLSIYYAQDKVDIEKASEYLDRLNKSLFEYREYIRDIAEANRVDAESNELEQKIQREIADILNIYQIEAIGFDLNKLKEITRLGEEYSRALDRIKTIEEQLAEIRSTNQEVLGYSYEHIDLDIDKLKETESGLIDKIGEHQVSISNLESRLDIVMDASDKVPEIEEQLRYWENERDICLRKADILNKLLNVLGKAKDNLSTQYLCQVEKNFSRYLDMVSPHMSEKTRISSDLNVMVTEFGAFKEQDFLSSGESDLINLCMRLSLIDAMFKNEKTFIIMDDPFIHLDDDKMDKILQLMKSISEEYQIIYLTCSRSRSIIDI